MHTWSVSWSTAGLLALLLAAGCARPPAAVAPQVSSPEVVASSSGADEQPTEPQQAKPAADAPATVAAGGNEADVDDESAGPSDELDERAEDEHLAFGEGRPHPLDGVSDEQLDDWLQNDPQKLGAMSVGLPNSGRLVNAVQIPESPYWERIVPGTAWATQETIDYLTRALAKVHEQFPDSEKLYLGDISAQRGGYLSPHLSHQSGRDVDISFFYNKDARWYRRATADNLDVARTWAFVRALITETDVRFVLLDRSLHPLLRAHAESIGEDPEWLDAVFRGIGTKRGAVVRHAPGHATHLHIRFDTPVAQEAARRCYRLLLKHSLVTPPTYTIGHKVKKGETLGKLAKRYGTTVPALKRVNGLKSSLIRAGRVYKIPRTGNAAPPQTMLLPRLLPPGPPKAGGSTRKDVPPMSRSGR